ncbi:glycosyltransferase family 4 protein [Virgibacillus salexigens]|uniref:glycosyltransferase family 4 protein n=1 Tax=Virgibacillus TaxID=84406 RepID=UPI00136DB91B|nr:MULTISPECIES: glycosyltransferase family 4 protein [Virgibacillus]MYL40665.1 glycosyltransferase [Virgibacillus massiliensis]
MRGKILQVCAVSTTVDKQLKPLIDKSISEGYEVHIACAEDGNLEDLRNQGYIVHDIHIDRKINFNSNIKSIKELFKLMRIHKYNIVHVHTPVASILGRIAAKLARVDNIIYTAHGFYFHEGMSKQAYNFYYRIEKYFAKIATDYLLLQSKEDYQLSVVKKFKKPNDIIHLGNGVDIYNKFNQEKIKEEEIINLKKNLGINQEDFVFAFIGRLVREKGIYELVEAFNNVIKVNKKVKLLLIGGLSNSERDQDISNSIADWEKNENIILTGIRSDIDCLLAASDTFILPSHREGLPRSIIEAMAMRKPVIATNIRGCREEVEHEETGYLFEKENKEELYSYMLKMTNNQGLRIKMGNKAREIAENEYDEEKILSKQLDLFNSLIK